MAHGEVDSNGLYIGMWLYIILYKYICTVKERIYTRTVPFLFMISRLILIDLFSFSLFDFATSPSPPEHSLGSRDEVYRIHCFFSLSLFCSLYIQRSTFTYVHAKQTLSYAYNSTYSDQRTQWLNCTLAFLSLLFIQLIFFFYTHVHALFPTNICEFRCIHTCLYKARELIYVH